MMEEIETYEVECGNTCGHWDSLNQCCWLSWHTKQEGDWCNYGLRVTAENEIYTPKELEKLRLSTQRTKEK